jgi:hypothetical protein
VSSFRNLTWEVNWYRHSELEGALLLGKVARAADGPALIHKLTQHCADEARHAWLWCETQRELGLPAVRIYRGYQSFYTELSGVPASLPEVLALTHVFEHRVDRRFREALERPGLPDPVRRTLRRLLRDERRHLDWVAEWLRAHPEGAALLRRFYEIDEAVYRLLAPYAERIWEVPGLGVELEAEEGVPEAMTTAAS